jgi:hypothetical protein
MKLEEMQIRKLKVLHLTDQTCVEKIQRPNILSKSSPINHKI